MSSVRIASLKPSPSSPSSASAGTPAAGEVETRQRMRRDDVDALARSTRPGASAGTTNAEMPRVPVGLAGAREHAVEVGDAAVGDPRLAAVEHPAAVAARARAAQGRDVGAGIGLGQREGGDRLAARDLRQPARLLLRRVPASVIAPLPRPCIANAKSARPSCYASVSRARHKARESSAGSAPPCAAGNAIAQPSAARRARARGAGRRHRHRLVVGAPTPADARPARRGRAASRRCAASKNGQSR